MDKKKKNNKRSQAQSNASKKYVLATLSMPEGISEKVHVEVMAVVQSTQFDKISIPLSAYRKSIGTQERDDDDRISTVGYIKDFDLEKNQFQVVIFNGSKEAVEAFKNPVIIPIITVYNDSLGTITKLIIDDVEPEPEDEVDTTSPQEEVTEDAQAEEETVAEETSEAAPKDDTYEEAEHLKSNIEVPEAVKAQVANNVVTKATEDNS